MIGFILGVSASGIALTWENVTVVCLGDGFLVKVKSVKISMPLSI